MFPIPPTRGTMLHMVGVLWRMVVVPFPMVQLYPLVVKQVPSAESYVEEVKAINTNAVAYAPQIPNRR